MKIVRNIIFAASVCGLCVSCNLDTMPYQSIDVDQLTPGNVETLTLGTYAYMKSNNGIMRSAHYFGEYGSDNLSLSGSTTDPLMNIYNYLRTTNNSRIADIWGYSYKTIININATLEVAPEGQSKEFDIIIGENYYLRAFHYFTLVNVFGQPYINSPETNLGVPIKLTTSMEDFPARATVKEVYEQIEKDLLKAIDMMTIVSGSTIIPKNSCYASKEVAEALLSRVYLYMENWEKAEKYADNVINSGRYSLVENETYKNYPTYVPENNKETIFAMAYYNASGRLLIANAVPFSQDFALLLLLAALLGKTVSGVWSALPLAYLAGAAVVALFVFLYSKKNTGLSFPLLIDSKREREARYISFSVEGGPSDAGIASGKIAEFCEEQEMPPKQTMLISMAIEEMLTLIMQQCTGYSSISVRLYFLEGTTILRIRNAGTRFDPITYYKDNISEDIEKSLDIIGLKYVVESAEVVYYTQTFGINNSVVIM